MQDQLLIDISHPVLRDHQVHGRHVLPGLGYVDLLHQIFREHGHDAAELALENLSIYRPLVVNDDQEILLDIDWQPLGADAWRIAVHGRSQQAGGADGARIQYVTAEMHRRGRVAFDETIDLAAIRQSSRSVVDAQEIYEACRHQGLVHAGLMKTEGTAYLTDSAIYVDLSLGTEGLESADGLMFHPALMDGSAVVAGGVLARASAGRGALSVPLFYELFQASALIQRRCFTRIALSSVRERNQLTYLTLELFNDSGRKIAELRDLGCREIHEAELIDLDIRDARPVTSAASGTPADVDAEQLLRRLLAARLRTPAEQMPSDRSFAEMGLTSADLLDLGRLIGEWAGQRLSPAFLFEHTTIAEVSRFLAGRTAAASPKPLIPRTQAPRSAGREGVAIVGISGRFPGAADTEELWERLAAGSDCITEVPAGRWDHALYFDPSADAPGKTRCKWGGFIEGVDEFDPLFFNISPREAELMDPQGRLFLQTVWSLLEGSGHSRGTLQAEYAGKVGVYVGSMYQHYTAPDSDLLGQGLTSLSSYSAIANRVSHFFGLLGPSIAVDTMCSSSMTAMHMACKDLLLGECELAIAGGVNLSIHPKKYLGLSAAQLIGSHAGSRSFSQGDGYLPAETVGAVLLKPLARAVADGDPILGVIRSSAVNHGGRANGYTVPNPKAQAELIAEVLFKANVDARTISYVEAAANGSASGDLIELAALTSAFGRSTGDRQFCAIGSVKSNIGHAEAASGLSQLAKVLGQMQHGQLAPASKAALPSPELQWEQTPFYLQQDLQEWKRPVLSEDGQERELPRRAIINSFGAGGAYASLLLEEHRAAAEGGVSLPDGAPQVVVLSAKNAERLGAVIIQLVAHLELRQDGVLADLAFTLQTRREAMESRLALVVSDGEELVRGLLAYLSAPAHEESPVPTFAGEVDDMQAVRIGAELDRALAMRDLRALAALWTQGADIPWHLLHEMGARRAIALPTYPFRRDRYWFPIAAAPLPFAANVVDDDELEILAGGSIGDRIRQYLTRFLSQSLRIPPAEIHPARSFDAYGFDSIIAMRLLRAIERRLGVRVTGRALLQHRTIDALAIHLEMLLGDGNVIAESDPAGEEASDLAIQLLERYKLGQLSREDLEALIDQGAIA
jgi:phthiocerol/phenolphthiocerol synthesis type-I polyketide synthase A